MWRVAVTAPGSFLSGVGNALSCALLPSCCSLCGSFLPRLSETPVCESCWGEVSGNREHCCARCGEDLFEPVTGAAVRDCRACRTAPPAFVRMVSAGVYEGAMRHAIQAFKYDRMSALAPELGRRLAEAIATMAADAPREMLVVAVPLHRERMAQRGFNQARLLASEAIRILATRHPAWQLELSSRMLVRQRSTESQAGLTPRQRRLNLRGAFLVSDPEAVRGRHVLLVDDIYTTGATARACSLVLAEAGAASVRVATLARAQRRFPMPLHDEGDFMKLRIAEGAGEGLPPSKTTTVH